MQSFINNLTIKSVLRLFVLVLFAGMLFMTAVNYFYNESTGQKISSLALSSKKLLQNAGEMKYIIANSQRLALQSMLSRDPEVLLIAPVYSNRFYEIVDEMLSMIDQNDLRNRLVDMKARYRDFIFEVISTGSRYIERTHSDPGKIKQVNMLAENFIKEINEIAGQINSVSSQKHKEIESYLIYSNHYHLLTMAATTFLCLMALLFIEWRISQPFSRLLTFIRSIDSNSNFLKESRIENRYNDELSELGVCINRMLDHIHETTVSGDILQNEIEERKWVQQELTTYKNKLEELVVERTAELEETNKNLKKEISDRKEAEKQNKSLEEQLINAKKLESIGTLAGGVAHDFNNLLMGIGGFAEIALSSTDPDSQLFNHLKEILKIVDRGSNLTRQLLTFSRQQSIEPTPIFVKELVEDIVKMLRRLIGDDIVLNIDIAENIGMINVDRGQMEQVLVNLVVNARDAMTDGGEITIKADCIDSSCFMNHEQISSVDYESVVLIEVSDKGCGMSEYTVERVFDPFFSTKDAGKGTGLGLSTVYGIIDKHGGHVKIVSKEGVGTTVKIFLNQYAVSDCVELAEWPEVCLAIDSCFQKHYNVLLVEDDDVVSSVIFRHLQLLGLGVISVSSPYEAEEIFNKYYNDIHLLLTDVVMPGCDGLSLSKKLKSISPELKVVFMSGYPDQAIPSQLLKDEEKCYLRKPFKISTLHETIHKVLS